VHNTGMSKSYASTNLCASKIPSYNNPPQQWMPTPPLCD
jgi:hypothetical protein